jgi:helicase
MGNKWLTNNDFSQMLGRAGRPSYHDMGKVYLLPELGKEFENESEEQKAIELLDSDVDNINVEYNEDETIEQVLADISAIKNVKLSDLEDKYNHIETPILFDDVINTLIDKKLVMQHRDNSDIYLPTKYGRAASVSFLTVAKAEYIRKHLNQNPLRIVENLEPFDSAYISNRLSSRLSKALKTNVSSRLFADSNRDIITSGDVIANLDDQFADKLISFQIDFMDCECKERPFCRCLERNVSDKIIKQRLNGWSPNAISKYFMNNYDIHIYPGDIFSWLDSVIRMIEAISRISLAFNNKKTNNECKKLIKKIEIGR